MVEITCTVILGILLWIAVEIVGVNDYQAKIEELKRNGYTELGIDVVFVTCSYWITRRYGTIYLYLMDSSDCYYLFMYDKDGQLLSKEQYVDDNFTSEVTSNGNQKS